MNKTRTKKNQLFLDWRDNEVHTLNWFKTRKIGGYLVQKYLQSGLIKRLGGGAYIKFKDQLDWKSAIFTLQQELKLPVHIGGRSALDLHGVGQYLKLGKKSTVFVIIREKLRIPIWLKANDWGVKFRFKTSNLFGDKSVGLETLKTQGLNLFVSSRERSIMEMIDNLDLNDSFDLLEEYFEELVNMRSSLIQELLESCNSVKVKRVFLYMLNYLELPVSKKIKMKKIKLGSGKRVIVKSGKFDKIFNITVPKHHKRSEIP